MFGCRFSTRLASQWEGRSSLLNCSLLTLGLEQEFGKTVLRRGSGSTVVLQSHLSHT